MVLGGEQVEVEEGGIGLMEEKWVGSMRVSRLGLMRIVLT